MIAFAIPNTAFWSLFVLISLPRSLSTLLLFSILLLPNMLCILGLSIYTLHIRCAKQVTLCFFISGNILSLNTHRGHWQTSGYLHVKELLVKI